MLERGQTETLGFVLVFALITASIGLVYATGFSGLNDAREFEQVNNAERAFEVLADNIEDITHRNVPSRSTEIKLASAELRIGEETQIEVNDPDSSFNNTINIRPVVYDPNTGSELVYSQGAVIRAQDDAGIVIAEGTFVLGENRTIIPIVQTRLAGQRQAAGSVTVLLRAERATTRLLYVNSTDDNKIWFNITSPRASIWRDHLTSRYQDVDCLAVNGSTVSCHVTTDRIHVTIYRIDLGIDS